MNLFRYIDRFSCYTFQEVPFNELDNAIFATLSYVDLKGIVSPNRYHKKTIREVGHIYAEIHSKKEKDILAVRNAIKALRYIQDTRRYGDLFLYNYVYESGQEEQFCALTIEINSKLVYVSFEGTDHLVSGWKEDFMLSYMFPVESQRRAIDYVNKNFFFRRKEIILGGHSKGGNLAMVAGMYANLWVRDKIIMIYNNDGPGLLKEQIESDYYKNIQSKLVHIIPNYSVVGLLLRHTDNYIVVRSARRGIFAHDLFTWVVQDKAFLRTDLSLFSKTLDNEFVVWLNQYDREQRRKFVISLFDIFNRANITSLVDVMENKKLIFHLIAESKELDGDTKRMLKDFLLMLFKCFKDVKKEELLSIFSKR
ncbi:MAG: DUF2974 domain-containing protein [Erysipelotrichaceae bacterium]|nr:DUF2974 domain-containing protein [Erysipelotrichaceae bacterium]